MRPDDIGPGHAQPLLDAIARLLVDHPPAEQGAVLAAALGIWLAGYNEKDRAQLLTIHMHKAARVAEAYAAFMSRGC